MAELAAIEAGIISGRLALVSGVAIITSLRLGSFLLAIAWTSVTFLGGARRAEAFLLKGVPLLHRAPLSVRPFLTILHRIEYVEELKVEERLDQHHDLGVCLQHIKEKFLHSRSSVKSVLPLCTICSLGCSGGGQSPQLAHRAKRQGLPTLDGAAAERTRSPPMRAATIDSHTSFVMALLAREVPRLVGMVVHNASSAWRLSSYQMPSLQLYLHQKTPLIVVQLGEHHPWYPCSKVAVDGLHHRLCHRRTAVASTASLW